MSFGSAIGGTAIGSGAEKVSVLDFEHDVMVCRAELIVTFGRAV